MTGEEFVVCFVPSTKYGSEGDVLCVLEALSEEVRVENVKILCETCTKRDRCRGVGGPYYELLVDGKTENKCREYRKSKKVEK